LEERKIGGLGIYLVLKSVDRVSYERRGDRNRVTLEMKRPVDRDG
ncbi:MAG: anti-sigma regulatory factor, partial [Verrucomicrobiia bacterium]